MALDKTRLHHQKSITKTRKAQRELKYRDPYDPFVQTDEEAENLWEWLYPELDDEWDCENES